MFEVLWMTYEGQPLIHQREFSKHNDVKQHIVTSHVEPKLFAWRNCDVALRNWWNNQIESEFLLVIEWDVYINEKVNIIFGNTFQKGATFQEIKTAGKPWYWWRESSKIPMRPAGVVPFGVALYDRDALNKICDPKYDNLFRQDIFCELRMGSVLLDAGVPMNAFGLPSISYKNTKVSGKGIFHAVKESQILLARE